MATKTPCKLPSTAAEWRAALALAEALLLLDSARQYGLVSGGPTVNVERCETLLKEGKRRGLKPDRADVDEWVKYFAAGTS